MTSSPPDASVGFGAEVSAYARRRPDYPASVFAALGEALTGPRERAVDVGAGSGQATRALARLFRHVTAVEPDARMASAILAPDNVEIVCASAEGVDFDEASVDCVIAATAFHWMDQKQVIAAAHRWLRPGGVFFPFAYDAFRIEGAGREILGREEGAW